MLNELKKVQQILDAAQFLAGALNGIEDGQQPIIRAEHFAEALLNSPDWRERQQKNNTGIAAVKEEDLPPQYKDGSFRQRKNGLKEYRFMHLDKLISVYGHSKKECWDKRTKIMTGETPLKGKARTTYTVNSWLIEWYYTWKSQSGSATYNATMLNYINKIVNPAIGEIKLKDLDGKTLQKFINDIEAPNTRLKIGFLLKSAFRIAFEDGIIKKNPFATVRIRKHIAHSHPVLQPAEQRLVFDKTKDNPKFHAFFMLLCCTGMRLSEAINAIPHIDYEKNVIYILDEDKSTKKHKRQIPFLPELIPDRELLNQVTATGAQTYFKRLFKGLDMKLVVHSFRATFASCCYHIGIRDKQIQEWLGHRTLRMTMDTYTHLLSHDGSSPILEYLKKLKDVLTL